jgi:GPH family glycoside/pentoside/hexuronide:cation symporter
MTADLALDPPPLRIATKANYGVGAIASGVAFAALSGAVLQYYLNQVVRLPAIWVGTAIMVSLIVDAIIDPLVGQWSDKFRSKWGRRHPFMLASAFLAGASFFFLWNAPTSLAGMPLLAYMLVMLIAVRVSVSLYEIPSNALAPELAPDYDARTVLASYRFFFFVLGLAVMSYLLNGVFLRRDAAHPLGLLNRQGYEAFGLTGGIVIFIAILWSCAGTQNRIAHLHMPPERRATLSATFREIFATLSNPSLLVLLIAGLLAGVGGGIRTGLDIYLYIHLWGLAPSDIALIVPVSALGSFIAVFAGPFLSKTLGKKMTMVTMLAASAITGLLPIVFKLIGWMPHQGSPWVMVILLADQTISVTLAIMGLLIVGSMVADVVEDAAVKTGVRAEGLLFATNGLTQKFTAGIGAFIAGLLVTAVHFPTHALQGTVPMALMRHLVFLFLPSYAVLVSMGIGVLIFYRIDRNTHEHNLEQLREVGIAAVTVGIAAGLPPDDRTGG